MDGGLARRHRMTQPGEAADARSSPPASDRSFTLRASGLVFLERESGGSAMMAGSFAA